MPDQWDAFKDAPPPKTGRGEVQDEWARFHDAPPAEKPTSQSLGFAEGFINPFTRLSQASESALDRLGYPASEINRRLLIGGRSQGEAKKVVDNAFARAEQSRKPGDVGKFAGGMAASVPIMVATRNPFAGGAASGAFLSEAKDLKGTAKDAVVGAVAGKAGEIASSGAGKLVRGVTDKGVQLLAERGVKLTPGQAFGDLAKAAEDKAMSLPFVGGAIRKGRDASVDSFNRSGVGQALANIGERLPKRVQTGHEAIEHAQEVISKRYDQIVPNLSIKADPRLGVGFKAIGTEIDGLPTKDAEWARKAIAAHVKFDANGSMSGVAFKRSQSELGRLARTYGASQDPGQREAAQVLRKVSDQLGSALERQNPAAAKPLKGVNRAYAVLVRLEDAASRSADGRFSPAQLGQAVRRADPSVRKRASASGNAFMQDFANAARSKLPASLANSGTADRLNAFNPFMMAAGLPASLVYNAFKRSVPAMVAKRPAAVEKAGEAMIKAAPRVGVVTGTAVSAVPKKPR